MHLKCIALKKDVVLNSRMTVCDSEHPSTMAGVETARPDD